MNNKEQINKLVEDTLNSFDDVKRAEPKPFLLTRINARMSKESGTAWEKVSWFISRPAVAFTGLCLVLLINAMVIVYNKTSAPATVADQVAQNPADEFSYSVATIYDNENPQP